MKRFILFTCICLLMAPIFVFSVEEEINDIQPQYYDDAKVFRVKYFQGETWIKRSFDEGLEEASINLPIFEKDIIGTDQGRLEIYMGRLNYLRLDNNTEVELEKIPQLRKTDMRLRVLQGNIFLDIEALDFEKDIEIQTADCGIFIIEPGIYRINVNSEGISEVLVYNGMVEVAGNNFNANIRENQKVVMASGEVRQRPFYFYQSGRDDFNYWNENRNSVIGYARNSGSQYLDSGYEEYEYELTRSGRWSYNTSYNSYIWIPYNIDSYWRPYYNGRWIWHPFYGNVWSSYDSWGWFTHHYGRWHWDLIHGWYWIPGYHWSPAWVYWYGNDDYYGWCPLSYWNRPVVIINNRWVDRYDFHRHGFPIHSRSNIIIKKKNISSAHVTQVALNTNHFDTTSNLKIKYKGTLLKDQPAMSKVEIQNSKGKWVVYKEGGVVSKRKDSDIRMDSNVLGKQKRTADTDNDYKSSDTTVYKKKTDVSETKYRSKDSSSHSTSGYKSSSKSSSSKTSSSSTSKSSGSGSKSSSSSSSSGGAKKVKKEGGNSLMSYSGHSYQSDKTGIASSTTRTQGINSVSRKWYVSQPKVSNTYRSNSIYVNKAKSVSTYSSGKMNIITTHWNTYNSNQDYSPSYRNNTDSTENNISSYNSSNGYWNSYSSSSCNNNPVYSPSYSNSHRSNYNSSYSSNSSYRSPSSHQSSSSYSNVSSGTRSYTSSSAGFSRSPSSSSSSSSHSSSGSSSGFKVKRK